MSETGTLSTDSSYTATTISSIIPEPPRPPRHQTSQPGAFRVTDIDGGSNENEEEDSVSNTTTRTPQSDPPVLAEVVNEDEENQRIRELIDREVEERERERMMEREGEIPEAEIVEMIEKNHCISNTGVKIWCGIAVVLMVTTVAIILGTVLVPRAIMMDRASDDPPTSSPSRQEVLQELESLLSLVSFDNGTALQMPLTPQNMALNWLANNTNLDTYSDAKKIQRFALATLFYSTNGTTWYVNDTWMSNHEDECGWYNNGASLCTRGSIDRLNLEMNNLVGKIPNELALLSNLTWLYLGSNNLTGTIATEIALMTNLNDLYLYNNSLTGTIPSQIELLTSLNFLYLHDNNFTGEFTCPASIDYCYISCPCCVTDDACRSF
jgi:hypothetical protein